MSASGIRRSVYLGVRFGAGLIRLAESNGYGRTAHVLLHWFRYRLFRRSCRYTAAAAADKCPTLARPSAKDPRYVPLGKNEPTPCPAETVGASSNLACKTAQVEKHAPKKSALALPSIGLALWHRQSAPWSGTAPHQNPLAHTARRIGNSGTFAGPVPSNQEQRIDSLVLLPIAYKLSGNCRSARVTSDKRPFHAS